MTKIKRQVSLQRIAIMAAALLACLSYGITGCQITPYQEGERIYKKFCSDCHMDAGDGLNALMPPLAGSDYLAANRDRLPCMIVEGLYDTIRVNGRVYGEKMPSMTTLSDIQITNVLNYINNNFGNHNGTYRLDEVRAMLEKCKNTAGKSR
jgi:mono/diheme cytochrome c family protein